MLGHNFVIIRQFTYRSNISQNATDDALHVAFRSATQTNTFVTYLNMLHAWYFMLRLHIYCFDFFFAGKLNVYKPGNVRVTWNRGAFVQQLLQWKSNEYYIFWVYVCSLSYPACNTHAPYCHLWPAPLYNIFPHYLINGTIFEKKKLLNTKCVFWFSLHILSETFLSLWSTERDIINVLLSSSKVPVILVRLNTKLNFLVIFLRKNWNIKFNNNPSIESRVVPCGQTGGRTDMTKLIVAFRIFSKRV
jgi:hypothetical protein